MVSSKMVDSVNKGCFIIEQKVTLLPRFLILLVKLKKFDGSNYQKVDFFYSYWQLSENRIGKLLVNRGIRTRGLSHEYQFSVLL